MPPIKYIPRDSMQLTYDFETDGMATDRARWVSDRTNDFDPPIKTTVGGWTGTQWMDPAPEYEWVRDPDRAGMWTYRKRRAEPVFKPVVIEPDYADLERRMLERQRMWMYRPQDVLTPEDIAREMAKLEELRRVYDGDDKYIKLVDGSITVTPPPPIKPEPLSPLPPPAGPEGRRFAGDEDV